MKSDPPGQPRDAAAGLESATHSISRRDFLKGAGVAVVAPVGVLGQTPGVAEGGTPEQIHLTFGDDPSRIVFVSWASPAQATNPRVLLHRPGTVRPVIHAVQRTYTDGMNGQTVFTYHAKLDGLEPHSSYRYSVIRPPQHGHRLRHRCFRFGARGAKRPDHDHYAVLPRCGGRPGDNARLRAFRYGRACQGTARVAADLLVSQTWSAAWIVAVRLIGSPL
jgi:hypothetical protein